MDQKMMVHLHNGILRSREKRAPTLRDSMDGFGEYYAKWNKPSGESKIPYYLTYKWNLINKTNKQAKYNQRHWNKEQFDSNPRGGVRETIRDNGGWPSRSMHKGHMDKAKGGGFKGGRQGWVEQGAWWGENGDNCTWTTI